MNANPEIVNPSEIALAAVNNQIKGAHYPVVMSNPLHTDTRMPPKIGFAKK